MSKNKNNYKKLRNEDVDTSDSSFLIDYQGKGEPLVIAFGFVGFETPPAFDFFGRLKKVEERTNKKINKILLRDKENSWYQKGIEGLGKDVDESVSALKKIIAEIEPSKIYTIGQSMGAYGAILFGALLKAECALAFGTLAFIEHEKLEKAGDHRWLKTLEELEESISNKKYTDLRNVISGQNIKIELYYGNKADNNEGVHLDALYANLLDEYENVEIHPYVHDGQQPPVQESSNEEAY